MWGQAVLVRQARQELGQVWGIIEGRARNKEQGVERKRGFGLRGLDEEKQDRRSWEGGKGG